jgi:hypothetical protein
MIGLAGFNTHGSSSCRRVRLTAQLSRRMRVILQRTW